MRMLDDLPVVVAERPQRPDMLNLDALRPGALITLMNERWGASGDYEVLERPYHDTLVGNPVTRVRLRNVETGFEHDHFLSDMGLIPYYPARKWNSMNWTVEMVAAS